MGSGSAARRVDRVCIMGISPMGADAAVGGDRRGVRRKDRRSCPRCRLWRMRLVSYVGHAIGVCIVLSLGIVMTRSVILIDYHLRPCEIEHEQRHSVKPAARPGEEFLTEAVYQIVRNGCDARFFERIDWVTPRGPVQSANSSPPSWRVDLRTHPMAVRRARKIPENAMPGTQWRSSVSADWDAWGLWGGISKVGVQYPDIVVEVIDPEPEIIELQ